LGEQNVQKEGEVFLMLSVGVSKWGCLGLVGVCVKVCDFKCNVGGVCGGRWVGVRCVFRWRCVVWV